MMDLDTVRGAIVEAVTGPRHWDALNYLPKVASADQTDSDLSSVWKDASLADYFLVVESLRLLLTELIDGAVPMDVDAQDREFLRHCRYDATPTVPQLIACRRLVDAGKQTSFLLYQRDRLNAKARTQPSTTELVNIRSRVEGSVDPSLLDFLLSTPPTGLGKLAFLQHAVHALVVCASWCYVSTAVERWPNSLVGSDALRMLMTISVDAQGLTARPKFVVLTADATWAKLSAITETIGKTYPRAVRDSLKAQNAPCGSSFVAVLDAACAVSVALIRVVSPWLRALRSDEAEGEFDRAVETYWRLRKRSHPAEIDRSRGGYTDFVVPAEGDGAWPGSVVEVEYLVREMLMTNSVNAAIGSPQEMLAQHNGGWIWLRTPWSLPITLLSNANIQDWHRRAPLLGWMVHASTNPYPAQNIFANHDEFVLWMENTRKSQEQRQLLRGVSRSVESMVLPGVLGAGVLPFLFPDMHPSALGAMAAMIGPLIKILRNGMKPSRE